MRPEVKPFTPGGLGDLAFEEYVGAHLFEIVLSILTGLGLVIPVWYSQRQSRRALTYRMVAAEVFRFEMPGLEVIFKEEVLPNPHQCTIQLTNSGKNPIVAEDFERPIEISFRPCRSHPTDPIKILGFEVTNTKPESLKPAVTLSPDGNLVISPLLLNPGDSMALSILVNDCFDRDHVPVAARIKGISELEDLRAKRPSLLFRIAWLVLFVAGMVTIALGYVLLGVSWMTLSWLLGAYIQSRIRQFDLTMRRLSLAPV